MSHWEQCAHDSVLTMLHLCYYMWYPVWSSHHHPTTDPFCPRNRYWDAVAAVWASPPGSNKYPTAACFLKHRHLPCQAGMICHEKCWFLWILDGISDDLMIYRVGISNLGWHLMKTWLVNDEIHQPDICNLVLGWSLHGTLPHVATFPASSTEWIRETHCFSPIIPLCWTARAANWWWPIYLCMYVCIYLWWHIYL